MKKNLWIVFAAAISTSLLAQDATNSTPVLQAPPPPETAPATMPSITDTTPAPAPTAETPTNAPAAPKKKTAKKKAATTKKAVAHKPAAPELKTVPLVSGPAVVAANHVNVRSKAGLVGEVVTRMTNGQPVTVVEEIHLKKSGPEEPSAWAKILLPADTHVWVKTSYLDTNNAVGSKKLNLRAGPGENYGVVGTLVKGDSVQTVDTKGEWTQIQAPTNAYAYMAAQYLKQEEGGTTTVAMNNEATPMPTPEPLTNTETTMAPATTETPGGMPSLTDTNATAMAPATPTPTEPATPVVQEPVQRIVEHEGIVRSSFSIQAPTRFELVSPETKQIVNYLYPASTNLDLSRYKGLHIIVTGEEGLDERWKNTPVITIQRIQVLD